jgi:hypothetical protein
MDLLGQDQLREMVALALFLRAINGFLTDQISSRKHLPQLSAPESSAIIAPRHARQLFAASPMDRECISNHLQRNEQSEA